MRVWIIGSGGLLGSAVTAALGGHVRHLGRPVPWADVDSAVAALCQELETFCDAARDESWSIIWCAGVGVVGTSEWALGREEAVLDGFMTRLRQRHPRGRGGFVLSSSAGVYAGSPQPPFDESTPPAPLNAYGATKLRQEALVGSQLDGRVPVAVARISTLYGPGQNIAKPQGLITQVCLRAVLRRPVVLYVSMDTMRDYIFVDDAGHRMVELAAAVVAAQGSQPLLRVVASDRAVSISEIIGLVKGVSRHPVGVVQIARPASAQHVRDLRVRSRHPHESAVPRTPLRRGVQLVYDDIVTRTRRGELTTIAPAAAVG